ncbi:NUDIX hydrolase [Kitasatospora kifunensis]|uniref:8-oxo-dGTP diphosphatase n=1 Tax=Kitasatospora kifunensis TaxID=58351 RepID=A0A7W7RAV5_KITKI|nr:NUDIX hydrolase [Kitasatospora kifunensis]MBB4928637.1 8-oxo-dGTP diphosphatase [Kitasatospora kifunensis]
MTETDQQPPFDLLADAAAAGIQRPAASVLLVNRCGELLLVRRAANTLLGGLWELPGGGIEDGESVPGAVRRELGEETGITGARFTAYLGFSDYDNARGLRVREFAFAATLDHDQDVHLSPEHDAHRWVLPADLPDHLADHERDLIARHTAQPKPFAGYQPLPAYLSGIPAAPLWAALFFTTPSGEAVLLRSTNPHKGLQYPGGDAELTDRTPLHTAVRETWEETGIRLEPDPDLLPLVASVVEQPRAGWPTKVGFVYSAGTLTPAQLTSIRLNPDEHDEVVTLSATDLQNSTATHAHDLTLAVLDALRTGVPAHVVR